LMQAPRERLRGVISQRGSAFSHLAIIAHALGIPAVTGLGDLPLLELDRRDLVLDGYRGRVYVNPNRTLRGEFARLAWEERELSEFLGQMHDVPAVTPDGRSVAVLVNAGLPEDIPLALSASAEGVGLYRTELLFMTRERFPTEDQQERSYRQLLEAFAPHPVTLRLLDIGADKQLPYMPVAEPNPALGWRGIRILLDQPEILHTQLRAMLRAAAGSSNAQLLLPMIGSIEELDRTLAHLDVVLEELREAGIDGVRPPVGVMIEVPSAVYQVQLFAERADFLSVGTNDLTQYLLAVDRNNERVARLFDTLHPAVLKAISDVVQCGTRCAKPVSICGEIAADPAAVVLLLGMGATSLSVNAGDIARVKWVIRSIPEARARELTQRALGMQSAAEIREMLTRALDEAGLGGLVRPGRR
ncbi:MAG: phosphoenolpyruvate--protein phosphotransferase, partial [Gammaproteobacteria bacterium]|nr:phosphoenolpyruvate--protein phosphotransferase [Gammaproteobacteria bacterium]